MIATGKARTRNSASYRAGALRAGLLAALMLLQGCTGDPPSGGRESGPPPVVTPAREVAAVTFDTQMQAD